MNFACTLVLVLLAAYGLAGWLLSMVVVGIWSVRSERMRATSSRDLLALRLLPSAGALFLALAVVLPAFLTHEPTRAAEPVGPLLLLLALFALATLVGGIWRGWKAWAAAAVLLRSCGPAKPCEVAGLKVDIVDVRQPMVAVVGAWRPRIVAATGVLAACDGQEFRQVIEHEAAHISARDNLKLLLLLASPDALAWLPAGDALIACWRTAVEFEADASATGDDIRKRIALASALIKVARLSASAERELAVLLMPVALDDVEGRVRRLLAPPATSPGPRHVTLGMACALLCALAAVPLYGAVHEFLEALVAFGGR